MQGLKEHSHAGALYKPPSYVLLIISSPPSDRSSCPGQTGGGEFAAQLLRSPLRYRERPHRETHTHYSNYHAEENHLLGFRHGLDTVLRALFRLTVSSSSPPPQGSVDTSSKCGSPTCSIGPTREPLRSAGSQAPL